MLPQLARGEANKIFVIPSEFSQALGNLTERFAGAAASPPSRSAEARRATEEASEAAAADAREAAEAAREAAEEASSAQTNAPPRGLPPSP
jgi:hypothetical protein